MRRKATGWIMDLGLIGVTALLIAWGGGACDRPPRVTEGERLHDPARCSVCDHANARVPGEPAPGITDAE